MVFQYLETFYIFSQSDTISYFELVEKPQALTIQKVNDSRALYFGISSDIYSTNYSAFLIIIGNIVFTELLIILTARGPPLVKNFHRKLIEDRK